MLKAAQARQISLVTDHLVFEANNPNDPYLRIEGNRQAGPFDLVVDASGAGSRLSPLIPVKLSYGALWGIVDLPETERDLGEALRQRYIGARKMAGILPLGHLPGETGAKAAVFWSLKRSEYDSWREADIADWKAEVSEMWPDLTVGAGGQYGASGCLGFGGNAGRISGRKGFGCLSAATDVASQNLSVFELFDDPSLSVGPSCERSFARSHRDPFCDDRHW